MISPSCVLRDRKLLPMIYYQTVRLCCVKCHREFALDYRFAINDHHAGRESMSTNLQCATGRHCYQIEGRDRMKIKTEGKSKKPQPG